MTTIIIDKKKKTTSMGMFMRVVRNVIYYLCDVRVCVWLNDGGSWKISKRNFIPSINIAVAATPLCCTHCSLICFHVSCACMEKKICWENPELCSFQKAYTYTHQWYRKRMVVEGWGTGRKKKLNSKCKSWSFD